MMPVVAGTRSEGKNKDKNKTEDNDEKGKAGGVAYLTRITALSWFAGCRTTFKLLRIAIAAVQCRSEDT